MNKQEIAEALIRIKCLQDALKSEMDSLRQHIDVGEKVETPLGEVNMVDSSRTQYDEKGLFNELNKLNVDPNLIGDVVVKVNRKKFAAAITQGKIPSSLVDDYSETKSIPTLRIKPLRDNQRLQTETMERVASVMKK